MGMKVVIVSVTCHADGGEKGEVKLLAEGNVGVLVFKFACVLKYSDVKGELSRGGA
jgi:hypothetical protein